MARKTVNVTDVLDRVNKALKDSAPEYVQGRQALASLLEDLLMSTGNYHGFAHLATEFVEGKQERGYRPEYDDTRRYYY